MSDMWVAVGIGDRGGDVVRLAHQGSTLLCCREFQASAAASA
jgi:hypothetical protein